MGEESERASGPGTTQSDGGGTQRHTELYRHVSHQVGRLQRSYRDDAPWAVAALAKLRRGVGKRPGELIELAEWTAPGLFVANYRSDEVAPEEQAAHAAITLYALHQQSRSEGMHRVGRSLGDAARELRGVLGDHGEAGVLRRFNAIGTATTFSEVARHAQGLIQQFRAHGIGMDYALFADDLLKLTDPATASGVRNRWGRHFYRIRRSGVTDASPNASGSSADDAEG